MCGNSLFLHYNEMYPISIRLGGACFLKFADVQDFQLNRLEPV